MLYFIPFSIVRYKQLYIFQVKDPINKLYMMFFQSVIVIFDAFNIPLQSGELLFQLFHQTKISLLHSVSSRIFLQKIKKLKHVQGTPGKHTILNTKIVFYKSVKRHFKKREHGLCIKQRPTRKHRSVHSNGFRRTNHANFNKLRRTVEDSIEP